jgi:integrase
MLFLASAALDEVIARARALPRPIRGMHLLCNRYGAAYGYRTFNDHWIQAVRAAGVEGVHFHDIRAKAATDAKAMGMDYQSLLGHTTKAMSDKYIRDRETSRITTLPRLSAG